MSRIDTPIDPIDIPIDAPVNRAHRESVGAGIADIARFLQDLLGQRLVADMTHAKNPKLVGSWARGDHPPRAYAESVLRAAYQVAQLILQHDSEHVARAWFIGMNPQLDGESPATAISEGRTREVWIAAKAYVAGG